MIVGITGRAQHGKDSVAARLVSSWGFQRLAFADALREVALAADPYIQVERPSQWSVTDDGPVTVVTTKSYHRLSDFVATYGWDVAKQTPDVRRFLQRLGTEGVRETIGSSAWIDALERAWVESGAPDVVITDVRFPNEGEFIHRHGGKVIRVVRPNFESGAPAHASEDGLDAIRADYSLVNDGDLTDLAFRTDGIAFDLEDFARSYR